MEEINEVIKNNYDRTNKIHRRRDNFKDINKMYDLLRSELTDEGIISQFDEVVSKIRNMTNAFDPILLNGLAKKLSGLSSNNRISISDFIKTFSPSVDDLEVLLEDHKFNLNGKNDIIQLGMSEEFCNQLISSKQVKKDAGSYEIFIALVYGGKLLHKGDILIDGSSLEVKNIANHAAVGMYNDYQITTQFYNWCTDNLIMKTPTKIYRYNTFNDIENFNEVPPEIVEFSGVKNNGGPVSFEELYKSMFRAVMDSYAKTFDYLVICNGNIIDSIPATENLVDYLFETYTINLEPNSGNYTFEIRSKLKR